MRFEFFDLRHLHDRGTHVAQTLLCKVRAGDVFGEGREVDAGVLFGVSVGCCRVRQQTKAKVFLFFIFLGGEGGWEECSFLG